MTDYLSLLLEFQSLPRQQRRSTFMEIAGYPHYENVCSNILKFYLDPKEEHGMGDLLLRALFVMIGKPEIAIPQDIGIRRESSMEDRKRIDLMIDCSSFTLGIENKIYHWEANDLKNYARVIDALAAGKSAGAFKIILCLRTVKDQPAPGGGFLRFSYSQLWDHTRTLLGQRLLNAHPKWLLYLTDFMETTERLAGNQSPGETAVMDFFAKHHDLVERLVVDRQKLLNRVAACLQSICARILTREDLSKYKHSRGVWQTYTLANHFRIQGKRICIDLVGSLKGWMLIMFQLDDPTRALVPVLRRSEPLLSHFPDIRTEKDYFILQQWPLHTAEFDLEEALVTALSSLISAADSMSVPNLEGSLQVS